MQSAIGTKFKEAVSSVLPIAMIVLALAFTIAPLMARPCFCSS